MSFVAGPVTVEVPATSANLGPGFDSLGLALSLHDTLTAEVLDGGRLLVEVDGEGAQDVPRDGSHLVVRSMRATFDLLGLESPAFSLRCANVIPHARGLGSSSAAIVGGIVLARALLVDGLDRMDDTAVLELADRIEGHPDNVAPALMGGFVIAGHDRHDVDAPSGRVWAHRGVVGDGLRAVAFVPPTGVRTELARGLLPEQVTHSDAAANSGRTALLVAAIAGAHDQLLRATEDFLHQSHRAPAMPESLQLVGDLRAAGTAAFVSGAGPTVLALGRGEGRGAVSGLAGRAPSGWRCIELGIDHAGARVLPS